MSGLGRGSGRGFSRIAIFKNLSILSLLAGSWAAVNTGYFSPDRPHREQWERLERAKKSAGGLLVYQSSFASETPGEIRSPAGTWGRYNGATISHVAFDPGGVTVNYNGVPWIGAAFHPSNYEAQKIYRVTIDRIVEREPAALIVRNRQMDLTRAQIPVGSGLFSLEFLAPRGRFDKIVMAFIPDGRVKPQGSLRISSLKIERLED